MTAASLSGCGAAEAGALHANVSASTRVFQELRSRIVSLKLQPGTILNRAELAEAADPMRQHLSGTIGRLRDLMDAHPNLFAR